MILHRAIRPTFILTVLLFLATLGNIAWAQVPPVGATGDENGANSVQVQQERIQQLIDTLEDDTKRQELIAQLRTLIEAQAQVEGPDTAQSFGDQVSSHFSSQLDSINEAIDAILAAPDTMVELWNWLKADVSNEAGRARWLELVVAAAICVGAAVIAFYAIAWLARRMGRRIATFGTTPLRKLAAGLACFLLDLLPIVAFVLAGAAGVIALDSSVIANLITLQILSVLTAALFTCALVRVVTRPRRHTIRLLPVSDGVARDLNRQFYWIIGVVAAAYVLAGIATLVGMPPAGKTAFLTVAALIAAIMLIRAIIKHRRPLQYGIERSAKKGTIAGDAVHWLARHWHHLGVFSVIALLVTYIDGGDQTFLIVLGRIGLSLLALAITFALWRLVVLLNERHERRMKAQQPEAEPAHRSGTLLAVLLTRIGLFAVFVGLLVHIWLFDIFAWFGADTGRRLLEAVVTITIIIALAYVVNRAIAVVIDRIQHSSRVGTAEQRRRRMETLLPLLRNATAVVIIAVTALIVLSQIGLDITPLLASAGVIGIAIGFGAQSLVKDVITGLFILVEDTFGVGDIVTVAGYSGVVEEMSIRTIKLRDFSGTVHVIPFGVVDAASNMTRDFSFAVFEVGVSYDSDVDEVIACMREVDEELRSDPEMAAKIIEPIDIVGLDQFGDSAVVIKARTKVHPAQQWGVMRAYNRLLKIRFDERGIEIPFPQRTLHFMQTPAEKPSDVPAPTAAIMEADTTTDTPTPDSHD